MSYLGGTGCCMSMLGDIIWYLWYIIYCIILLRVIKLERQFVRWPTFGLQYTSYNITNRYSIKHDLDPSPHPIPFPPSHYLNVVPGSMGHCVRRGTPSMYGVPIMCSPCQWTVVVSDMSSFCTSTTTSSP